MVYQKLLATAYYPTA